MSQQGRLNSKKEITKTQSKGQIFSASSASAKNMIAC